MKNSKSYNSIIIFALIIIGGIALFKLVPGRVVAPEKPGEEDKSNKFISPAENEDIIPESSSPASLPKEAYIKDVPFVLQAPLGEWDELHEETCEEAAILTTHYYFEGKKEVEPEREDQDLRDLVDFEKNLFGKWKDTTTQETATLAEKKWGYKAQIKYDISLDDIKKAISDGSLVLLPANGIELKNPHYKQPGPPYHFVVAIGYKDNKIITNDPGTKFGKDYAYDENVLYSALGDWDDKSGDGRKAMIVLFK